MIIINSTNNSTRSYVAFTLLLFVVLICLTDAYAQYGTWERYYRGSMNVSEGGYDVCEAGLGYFYLTGYAMVHNGVGGDRLWVIKVDAFGDSVWSRIYYDIPRIGMACVPTSDHGLVVTGTAAGAYFVKIDSSGNIVWERTFGSSLTQPKDMLTLNDGSVIACGRVSFDSATVMKISNNGELIWQTKLLFGRRTYFGSIDTSLGGGYVIHGVQFDQGTMNNSFLIFFSINGQFVRKIDYLKGYRKVRTIESGYIVSGVSNVDSLSYQTGLGFFRTDSSGNIIHQRFFYDTDLIACTEFQVVNSNSYLMALTVDRGVSYHTKIILTDSMGNVRRENILRSAGYMEIPSSTILTNGNILFIGTADRFPDSWEDLYAAMTDSNLSYQPLSIGNYGSLMNEKVYSLYQNYPNPFNPTTIISYKLNTNSFVSIRIFDIRGRLITTLYEGNKNPGSYKREWSAGSESSGVYFYSLFADGKFIGAKSMVLLR
ncbi:MAG: T9SS type A sorting domain-containing protein [Ignavibacteria bacterium]|nr:T9SS type A sorting domain-containing protein [Ignavibacteria bacterium]